MAGRRLTTTRPPAPAPPGRAARRARLPALLAARRVVLLCAALAAPASRPASATTPPAAAPVRHALLIGANLGLAHEVPLQYAERDVDRLAEVLESLGDFAPERIVRVKGASAERVREILVDLNLTLQAQARAGIESTLFVFYSGHGSAGQLHLGGTTLKTDELSKLVRLSPARLKLLLVDACRAGTLTRVKGGRQVAPFQIGLSDALINEGYAIITSSAAGEDAQESDLLGSSIFTHHFIAALRGLGDGNGDRLVTLGEAYAYAYAESLRSSMASAGGTQHATFDYDLRGRADPVLTDLRRAERLGVLLLGSPGEYLVEPLGQPGPLVEARATRAQAALALPPARYRVRLRAPDRVSEAEVALGPGQVASLRAADMTALPLAQVVRKGEVAARLATGPSVATLVHGPIAQGFAPTLAAQLGWAFELPRLSLVPRVWFGRSESLRVPPGAGVAAHELSELALELAAQHVLDLGRVALAPQLSLGAARLSQSVQLTAGGEIRARPIALVSGLGGSAAYALGRGFALEASVELATFYLRQQPADPAAGGPAPAALRAGTVTYRAGLGLGYRY